jgi:hypothetical protein
LAITRARTSSVAQGPSTSKSFLANNPVILGGSYESIATANGTGSSGVITFSSIPSTYKHLQLRIIARGTAATTYVQHNITLNGVTGSGSYFAQHEIYGDGATAGANADAASTYMSSGLVPGASQTANIYGAYVWDLLDYTSTNKNKVAREIWGVDLNGGGYIDFRSSLALNTNAITSITITCSSGNYTTPSSFALYGIK